MKYGLRLALALITTECFAGVNYYVTDKLTSIDATKWAVTGNLSPGPSGLAIHDPNGGSLISKLAIPDGSNEAEVAATITLLSSGGVYTEFMQASNGAHTGSGGSGSYIAFEMQNPTFDQSHNCTATFLILQSSNNITSVVSAFQHSCRNGMLMRMAVHGKTALVWADDPTPVEFGVSPGAGQPGIGAYNMPSGNSIAQIQLGALSRTPPKAVDQNSVGVSAFRNRVDLQWKPPVEAADSPGIAGYWIYRDGLYFARTSATHFSDEAVTAGAKHIYTIYTTDQHFNQSAGTTITISTPSPVAKK